ncbi:MAG TPA: glycosyltransferase family 39 protein [Verrucomicrobiae bacterium]|nr:glycosyltransferase family 39 protein [Verrucomicrobiae bacterium]
MQAIGEALAALAALLHLAACTHYGYFRDELYFIACAKHLAWGYVDQPPLVAFAAWLSTPFGYALPALRALPMLAAALTVWLAVRLARELGGGRYAQWLTGVAVLLTPAYLLLGSTLTTTSFEPLSWTLAIFAAVRIVRGGGRRWWIGAALAVAFGAYGKYSIGLLVAGLVAGLACTRERSMLRTWWLPGSALLALLLLSPNLWWQAAHGFPMIAVLLGDAAHRPAMQNGVAFEYHSLLANGVAFTLEQLIYTSPPAAIVWAAGLVAPFAYRPLGRVRFVAVAYAAIFAVAVALGAKGYYVVGIYASLLAIGAVAIEAVATAWLRGFLLAVVAAVGIVAMPMSLPLLPVDTLIAYTRFFGLTGRGGAPAHLIQPVFAEEFGWDRLARDVAAVYDELPAADRASVAIYADTYGDAGALGLYGPRYGLPPAISSQNTYYLWGPGAYDGKVLIAIGATRIDLLRRYYRSVVLVRESIEPYKWVVEGPAPIYLCRDPVAPLREIWPHLRWYGA